MLRPHSKAPKGLVALASAAIIAVYGAGYARTRSAGMGFAETPAVRRPAPSAALVHPAAMRPGGGSMASLKATAPTTAPRLPRLARASPPATPAIARPPETIAAATPAASAAPVSPAPAKTTTAGTPAAQPAPPVAPATTVAIAPDPTVADAPARPATDAASQPAAAAWRDGTYTGWGTSRHGSIQATIVVLEGRIAGASITQCLTQYSCSWIAHLPAQVLARQSADVDYVTGATQSVDAFYYAVLDALSKAK